MVIGTESEGVTLYVSVSNELLYELSDSSYVHWQTTDKKSMARRRTPVTAMLSTMQLYKPRGHG